MNRFSARVHSIEDELLAASDASDAVLDYLFPEESRAHYDDVHDHLVRAIDMIDTMRDYLSGSLDIDTTQQTQRVNRSMQRLSAIATILLPLTFITGIYGMNFSHIPESN
jgi:magnesium transporter